MVYFISISFLWRENALKEFHEIVRIDLAWNKKYSGRFMGCSSYHNHLNTVSIGGKWGMWQKGESMLATLNDSNIWDLGLINPLDPTSILYALLNYGRIISWQPPSCSDYFPHALKYQFETYHIPAVRQTTCRVWVSSKAGYLTYFIATRNINQFYCNHGLINQSFKCGTQITLVSLSTQV